MTLLVLHVDATCSTRVSNAVMIIFMSGSCLCVSSLHPFHLTVTRKQVALGSVSKLDISGRYSVLTTAALGAGATIGPAIAGLILQQADMLQVLMAAGLLILAGFSGITMALKRSANSLAASN